MKGSGNMYKTFAEMNDLISRAAAKEAIRNRIRGGATELARIFKEIDNVPAVDAVSVVRCKDCKYWDISCKSQYFDGWCFCGIQSNSAPPHWFCADGERREGNNGDAGE